MRCKFAGIAVALAVLCGAAWPQGVMTTFAGADWVFPGDGGSALSAPLGRVIGITVDRAGSPIVADYDNCVVARIKPDGSLLSVIAGSGICKDNFISGDGGRAIDAAIYQPVGVALDLRDNLYVSGTTHIRKSSGGIITTIAGNPGVAGFRGDGSQARNALINSVGGGLAVDTAGAIFLADVYNNRIRKISDGTISTIAGGGQASAFNGDGGPATSANLYLPSGVAVDKDGNVYIADTYHLSIRKVGPDGKISTVVPFVYYPRGLALDNNGTLYIGAWAAVYKWTPGSTTAMLIAGTPATVGYSGDGGRAIDALFGANLSIAPDNFGNVYVADRDNRRIRKISSNGMVTAFAGNGAYRYTGERVDALTSPLNDPRGLTLDSAGNLWLSEQNGSRVRKVTGGKLTTITGNGSGGYSGDGGPATNGVLGGPDGLAFDKLGNLYIADTPNYRVRKVTLAGALSTLAKVEHPSGLAVDSANNIFVSSGNAFEGSFVKKIDPNGNVTAVYGKGGYGFSGDGAPAAKAELSSPRGLAVDDHDNLYIADEYNRRIRMVTPQGIITTFAGNGKYGNTGDSGPAAQASFGALYSLTFDSAGNLYASDHDYNVVRKITPGGVVISTVAGGGSADQLGDGKIATAASLKNPTSLVVDRAGNLFIADENNHRIREVLAAMPTVKVAPADVSFAAPSLGTPITRTLTVTGSVSGLEFDVTIDTGGTGGWLTVDDSAASTPRLLTLKADPGSLKQGTYPGKVAIRPRAALPATLTVDVTFDVGPANDPVLGIDKPQLSFTLPQGVTARTASLVVSNLGGQTLTYAATASMDSGAWLSLSPASGQALPGKPSTLNVTADPAGLRPGAYTGQIAIQSDAGSKTVTVIVTVNSNPQAVLLTQTGMSFSAVAGGGVIPPQSFGVLNGGTGRMAWEAHTSTTSGRNWLLVSPASGSSDADAAALAPQVTVTVDAAGLVEGKYYGTVRIDAPSTANQSSYLTVFLNVLAKGTPAEAAVQPSELVFYATPGGWPPSSQPLNVYNISAIPKTFTTGRSSGGFLLYTLPENATLDPQRPTRVVVQPAGAFPARTFTGTETFQFDDGTVQSVKITMILSAGANPLIANSAAGGRAAETSCEELVVTFDTLSDAFRVPAGWPVALSVKVKDKCQNPLKAGAGSVWAQFDNGEDDVPMTALGDGTWQGTWKPRKVKSQVKVTIHARRGSLLAEKAVTGDLASQNDAPVFTYESITSAFSGPTWSTRPLAPGSLITIYAASSAQLSDQVATASDGEALKPELLKTQVYFNGVSAPLTSVGPLQIDAVVPWNVNRNTQTDVRILRGDTLSEPVRVDTADAQPTVRQNNGAAVISPPGRVTAGDLITISCAGLGITNPPVADGRQGLPDPRAATQPPVTVAIGGKDAEVKFAGLAPGQIAVYQVDVVVPSGVEPGDSVSLTVSVLGQTSPVTTLAVR